MVFARLNMLLIALMLGRAADAGVPPHLDFREAWQRRSAIQLLQSPASPDARLLISRITGSHIQLLLKEYPDDLLKIVQAPASAEVTVLRYRIFSVIEQAPQAAARKFLVRSVLNGSRDWLKTVSASLSSKPYTFSSVLLGPDFETVIRALAEDMNNIHDLGSLLFAGNAPKEAVKLYLPIIEGRLYLTDIPLAERRRAAGYLMQQLRAHTEKYPEILGIYDRLYSGKILTPVSASTFLRQQLGSADDTLYEWAAKRKKELDGLFKQAWRSPYNVSIEGLPPTSYELHQIDRFVPVKGKFENVRRLQELNYPIHYSQARQEFQNKLMKKVLESGSKARFPRVVFTAGPMGSGKTTSVNQLIKEHYFPEGDFLVIDPDRIREMLPEYRSYLNGPHAEYAALLTQHEAMDIADMVLEMALKQKKNIVFATSLRNHEHYSKLIDRIRKTSPSYQVEMLKVERSPEHLLRVNDGKSLAERGWRNTQLEAVTASIYEVDEATKMLEPKFDRVTIVGNDQAIPEIKSIKNSFAKPGGKRVAYNFFDIDWTLGYPLPKPASAYADEGWKIVEAQGQAYRVAEGLDDLVQEFLRNPDLKMAIASGGITARNLEFLQKVFPPSLKGKSLYDFVEIVQSYEDLQPGISGAKRFSSANKKPVTDALMVDKDYALFDDQEGFIRQLRGQGAWTGKSYEYFRTWEEAEAAIGNPAFDQRYVPKSKTEWFSERNKLVRFREIISEVAGEWRKGNKAYGKLIAERARVFGPRSARCLNSALSAFGR